MKIQVRKSVFETNSSTCHTIAIPKRSMKTEEVSRYDIYPVYEESYCFGRGLLKFVDQIGEKIAYSYMAILYKIYHDEYMRAGRDNRNRDIKDTVLLKSEKWKSMILKWIEKYMKGSDKDEIVAFIPNLLSFLEAQVLHIPIDIPKNMDIDIIEIFKKGAFIEHPEEIYDFVECVEKNPELLEKFIFDPDSYATACGDEWRGYYVRQVGFEYDYPDYRDEDGKPTFEDKIREMEQDWDFWMS